MPDQTYKIEIKRDLRPSYYDKFHCLAEGCRISCCKGWQIAFNKKDYLSLKRQKASPELAERIARGIHRNKKQSNSENTYAEFSLESGCCPLLHETGLCQLQLAKGHSALPEVCQVFPRGQGGSISNYVERFLSTCCEGVLELLWKEPEGISFCSDPLNKDEEVTLIVRNPESFALYFQRIRSWCIDMLQNRKYPLPERIMRMGTALKYLVDGEKDILHWLNDICPAIENQESMILNRSECDQMLRLFLGNNIMRLLKVSERRKTDLATIREDILRFFEISLQKDGYVNAKFSTDLWISARKKFEMQFADREYFMENLMVSLLYQLKIPFVSSANAIWDSFVNFCNIYSFHRFMAVMSCREGSPADKNALFDSIIFASRSLLHNKGRQEIFKDELITNSSATLAHMAVLLSN